MNKILDGKKVNNYLKEEYKEEISKINDKLKLVVIHVGNNEASNVYVKNKGKLCEEVGIDFLHLKYDDITEEDLLRKIDELNNDPKVTGILVQLPLPKEISALKVTNRVSYKKDVDGLTSINIGKLYNDEKCIIPCTALGIMKLLDYYKISLESKNVTIIGRSKLVGIPLFNLMMQKNASVSMCHSKTKDLKDYTLNSDILVVATGCKHLIKKDMIKENSILIDVGITREEGKLYGDIDPSCMEKCLMMTPVPGGVGPMTSICLINNILECYKINKERE